MTCDKSEEAPELGSELPSWTPELGSRLRAAIKVVGGGAAAGRIAGVSEDMISRYLKGRSKPSFYALAALAKAAGVSLDWIAGFDHQETNRDITASRLLIKQESQPAKQLDTELLGRITDAIAATYKSENARISPRDMGRLAGKIYGEITELSDDPTEREGMIKLKAAQLQRELRTPISSSDNSKASA